MNPDQLADAHIPDSADDPVLPSVPWLPATVYAVQPLEDGPGHYVTVWCADPADLEAGMPVGIVRRTR